MAAENMSAAQGYLYPHADAGVSGLRERRLFYRKGVPTGISAPYNLFNSNLSVSYTLDVFGGIRRQVEAYRAQEDYQRAQLEATYLALTANVVTAAVQEASFRSQIAATSKLAKMNESSSILCGTSLLLVAPRKRTYLHNKTQSEATRPPLRRQLEIERDLLRVLTGHFPDSNALIALGSTLLKTSRSELAFWRAL